MFYITIWNEATDLKSRKIEENLIKIQSSQIMIRELITILKYNLENIDFIDSACDIGFDCPLDVHCNYTRDQLLVAMDYMTPRNLREGVIWLPEKNLDVFMVTLNKSEKDY